MLTLYRPGTSIWHRLPAGRKTILLTALVLGLSLLPTDWGWRAAAIAAAVCLGCYAVPGIGMRPLVTHLFAVRLILVFTLVSQLLFAGGQGTAVNTTRLATIIAIASLLALTTRTTDLLDVIERGLTPLARLRIDPQRVALLLAVSLNTLPVLARATEEVREAQRARGGRASLRLFAVPFLIVALKHADDLGDALTARGVK